MKICHILDCNNPVMSQVSGLCDGHQTEIGNFLLDDEKPFDLSNSCEGKFCVGDKVKTRGDFGGFNLIIKRIHNNHFCEATGYGKHRHFNMNIFEKR